ncbi:hypothetical protein B0A50_03812 [Salinomyces thailandicus]|uniref:Uncharacterized protein n=1 Tax=Salinomyces thailandicus TaxID=706561 RepID=A0A4U0U2P2_9PEZI|nr:hypothetical protein B0A50_03812 [Salinomyces thailandica]
MRFLSLTILLAALAIGVLTQTTAEWKWGKMVEGTPGPEVMPTTDYPDDTADATATVSVEARGIMAKVRRTWHKVTGAGEMVEEEMRHDLHRREVDLYG